MQVERIIKPERDTQNRAIDAILSVLPKYRYIGNLEEVENSNIREDDLRSFLKKKQKHADHRFKNQPHIVKPGESMYMISQMYGIQLKELYKKNDLSPDYQIKVGDRIRIY